MEDNQQTFDVDARGHVDWLISDTDAAGHTQSAVKQIPIDGSQPQVWPNMAAAEKALHIRRGKISDCLLQKCKKPVANSNWQAV